MLYRGYHAMNNEWITVANASRLLGVSKQAIRQRIYRNTISHRKDAEGTVFVRITGPNPDTNGESYGENTAYTEDASRERRAQADSGRPRPARPRVRAPQRAPRIARNNRPRGAPRRGGGGPPTQRGEEHLVVAA